ncbi:hypothetical protein SDC9_191176 [bioreactor metagenome]|uniref:Uncharacterized protein n=1 Tax=bioreactor metagenome TaxID=1076179 RepID=A0A645HYE8_9ZZZZ
MSSADDIPPTPIMVILGKASLIILIMANATGLMLGPDVQTCPLSLPTTTFLFIGSIIIEGPREFTATTPFAPFSITVLTNPIGSGMCGLIFINIGLLVYFLIVATVCPITLKSLPT